MIPSGKCNSLRRNGIIGLGANMDDIWAAVNQLKLRTSWTREDIELLTNFIADLIMINENVARELGMALESLESLHKKLEFYRRSTTLRVVLE